jgi:glycosyltransferase involved in cell wall biosynthesis
MKILLIGEYSRLHNSLKEGLHKHKHEVTLLGFNDGFKNYPVDFKLEKKWNRGLLKKIKVGIYLATGFDITSYLTYRYFIKHKLQFTDFDIVQLINENSFYCEPYYEKKILNFIFQNNKKVFLLSCGDDYLNVKYNFNNPQIKSVVQPFLLGKIPDKNFLGVLKFRKKSYEKLNSFLYHKITGVIASDIDYHLPLINNCKYLGLIPNPININNLDYEPLVIQNKIILFFGINNDSYFKKGGDFFQKALDIIKEKYTDKVEIIITRSVPYQEYINLYNKAHILLDQVYAFDQGYNALEAMAKGKVVFTGAESEFMEFYNLTERVAINALPDIDYLVNELSFLIENPEEIIAIGKRARAFIEKEHDYIKITKQYLEVWERFSENNQNKLFLK